MRRIFWMMIACVALATTACSEAETTKEPVDLPGELTAEDDKGDWRTKWYTDVRGELSFNDTVHEHYAPAWPNYYFAYEIELEANDVVNLRVGDDGTGFDPVIGLYGPQRSSGEWGDLIAVNDDTPEGGSYDSWIQFEADEGGRYLMIIREYDWYSGDFWASMTCEGGPCETRQCPEILCDIYCPYGHQLDENGCEKCACKSPPVCPENTTSSDTFCAQVITWGKDPNTDECCQYPTPCQVPDGWEEFNSETACQGGAQEGEGCSMYGARCADGLVCEYECPDGSNDPNCNLGINPTGTCVPAECQTDADCFTTGCSGQVCAAESVITTCEWQPEYACYQQYGDCGCNEGRCGWSDNTDLNQCLSGS